ncbi:MAG: glycerophosphodiester phosphodiesterase [SAR324 cluster bacterium]|nr:glycerophosphodiester phosphodiesterase [SAR324 cluster bacterium]MBL7034731.1 glycerophosphodiester phosphodiesterase [SAR324 cluster bacterium]
MQKIILLVFLVLILGKTANSTEKFNLQTPLVLAHRGASGYLPEHTLAAVALAHGLGADFIEQDVVLSRDNQPVVLHDLSLDATTNVSDVFPGRNRSNGSFYAIDFTLAELKKLHVYERRNRSGTAAKYPRRFPRQTTLFKVISLQEEIELIQGMNKSTGRNVGLFVELKAPEWHHREGRDLSAVVLKTLNQFGYKTAADQVYVQSFSANELKRLRSEFQTELKLVQLIGENRWELSETDFDQLRTVEGLVEVAAYADGIGPWIKQIVSSNSFFGNPELTSLVSDAHQLGMKVFPYTIRADALPGFSSSFNELLQIMFNQAQVDGVFTDFPDKVRAFLKLQNNAVGA